MNASVDARSFLRLLAEIEEYHSSNSMGLLNRDSDDLTNLEDEYAKKQKVLEALDTYYVNKEHDIDLIVKHLDGENTDTTIAVAPWVKENGARKLIENADEKYGIKIEE